MKRSISKRYSTRAGLLAATAIIAAGGAPAFAQQMGPLNVADAEIEAQQNGRLSESLNDGKSESLNEQSVAQPGLVAPLAPIADADGFSLSEESRVVVTMGGNIDPFAGSIDPFAGSIDPFAGSIDPFAGSIDPFAGSIDPFAGSIDPFAGSIDPFAGSIDPFGGIVNPFHGEVRALWRTVDPYIQGINANAGKPNAFWGDIDPTVGKIDPQTGVRLPSYVEISNFWSDFGAQWRTTSINASRYNTYGGTYNDKYQIGLDIYQLVYKIESRWGKAVKARTGQTAEQAIVNPIFAKYGIGTNRGPAFLALTAAQRAQLVTELFDGLNEYTGHNQLDHWMRTVNWNPELTKLQGSGSDAVIGILDSSIVGGNEFAGNVFHSGGYTATVGAHGVGVASLLIGAHDGQGVMGIAPNASVATYNPFDASGSASWTDIRNGIISLKNAGASVINMSLGVSGWTLHSEWNNIFIHGNVKDVAKDTVFVIAAGNDGITQTQNVEWKANKDFGYLIVGAVDAVGNVSSISNRPGSACLVEQGECKGDYLRDHFLVAPGELILVSDGHGGVTRRSGTSFAAPLVSGAITLLHDRWPWLAEDPEAAVDIILGSARDLGTPGVDDVYGHGLLDVEASQSPLDFNNLKIYEYKKGKKTELKSADILSGGGGIGATWEADGVFLTLFEDVASSQRDFVVPFSDQLIGQKSSVTGSLEYFQSFISKRFKKWSRGGAATGGSFTDVASFASPNTEGWTYSISATNPAAFTSNGNTGDVPHSAVRISNESGSFTLNGGYGQGSIALLGQESFGLTSDYNAQDGGLNPVLGLASGGGFVDAEFAIGKNTTVAFGVTNRKLDHSENDLLTNSERFQLRDARDYQASAFNLRMTHKPTKNSQLSLSIASLDERDGLLGVQSRLDSDLSNGSNSKTLTFGGSVDLPHGISIAASATAALTKSSGDEQNLQTSGAVRSSAYAFSIAKQGIVGKNDRLRMSFTQPLHIENGDLEYSSVEVIDRATGEVGEVTRSFSITDKSRRYTGEFLYATPVMEGGELSFFGRADYDSAANGGVNEIIAGGMLSIAF